MIDGGKESGERQVIAMDMGKLWGLVSGWKAGESRQW